LKISLNIKKPKLLSAHLVLLESPQQVGFKKSDFEKKNLLNFEFFLSMKTQINYKNGF